MRSLLPFLLLLAACGDDGNGPGDAEPPPDGPCAYPGGPYGTRVGDKLRPFSRQRCDGSTYDFLDQTFCDSQLTVISIAAGWCTPCLRESDEMEERVNAVYGPRGVRVVQVIIADDQYVPATPQLCNQWVERYGLSNPVVIDPDGALVALYPTMTLPSTTIVDDQGIVRFAEIGALDGLTSLTAKLDDLLAGD